MIKQDLLSWSFPISFKGSFLPFLLFFSLSTQPLRSFTADRKRLLRAEITLMEVEVDVD